MKILKSLSFLALLAVVLQGCSAVSIPLSVLPGIGAASYALDAFLVYKAVQMNSGGTAEVRFSKENPATSTEDKEELSSMKKLAILPGHRMSTLLAQEFSRSKQPEIVTPFQIEKTVGKKSGMVFTQSMTETERSETIKEIMETMESDGALDYRELSGSSDINLFSAFSFNGPEVRITFSVRIISRRTGRIILNLQGEYVLKNFQSFPPQEEIDPIFTSAIKEKLMDVANWKATAQQ